MSITDGAQEEGRLHRQVLQHAAGDRRAQGYRHQGRHQGRPRRQDDRRAGGDHALQLFAQKTYTEADDQALSERLEEYQARPRQWPPRRRQRRRRRAEQWLNTAGRRLLQARRHRSSRWSRSTVRAPASPCARATTRLREQFNTAIDAIRANGKYKEINDKYFKFDVYGGELLTRC